MSLLKVENLTVSVANDTVLSELSFEINEKGIYAILGKNSIEKTTLAKALSGIVKVDSGKIFYKDVELSNDKKGREIKAKIGYVPQECFLYSDMTVYESLELTGRMRKVDPDKRIRQIKEALELLELSNKNQALIKALTVSEKRRLLLANALIGNPSVLILDEPTANATAQDAEIMRDVISMLGERKTVLIFTEKLTLANEMANYVGIMSNGKMALWSSLDNIKEKLGNDSRALVKTFMAFSDDSVRGVR